MILHRVEVQHANPKRRPTHPDAVPRKDVLPALPMTQIEFARRLGVSRLSVSELLREKRVLSPEMAARIARLLHDGGKLAADANRRRSMERATRARTI